MTNKLFIDFETYSDLDITKVGAYKYINHPSFHPWCMAYAFNDGPIKLWTYHNTADLPEDLFYAIVNFIPIYAYNAEFEWLILNKLIEHEHLIYTHFVDVMALAGTFGYPLKLDKFVKAIGMLYGKTAGSTRLINKLCKPQKKTAFNTTGKWTPETAPEDFTELYTYCMNDVHIMREAVKLLPQDHLTKFEQFVWGHTMLQNSRGVRIDIPTVKNIVRVLRQFKRTNETRLQTATSGNVKTGKQVKKIKDFLWSEGVKIPNLAADTVDAWISYDWLPQVARDVLELRKALAHSSTAKFDRMLDMEVDEFIYGMLKYFGAHTGRYAGTGVQLHNLPRASLDDPEFSLTMFNHGYNTAVQEYPDINATASKLIRPMIIARPGHKLIVSDYKSIENVLLHWCAGDEKTIQEFRDGKDQYKTYASDWFGITYEVVSKDQRQQAKPDVLGLGYGGGKGALIGVAANHGITLTPAQAQKRVDFYRKKKYPKVPKFWYEVYNKAILTLATGDRECFVNDYVSIWFEKIDHYLTILLPSGRRLWYPEARLNYSWTIMVNKKPVLLTSKISYMGIIKSNWARVKTHPGGLVENIIQALARDILVYGAMCAEQAGYKILFSVHDELVAEVLDDPVYIYSEGEFSSIICKRQKWARTLPLSAEGFECFRYRKE